MFYELGLKSETDILVINEGRTVSDNGNDKYILRHFERPNLAKNAEHGNQQNIK